MPNLHRWHVREHASLYSFGCVLVSRHRSTAPRRVPRATQRAWVTRVPSEGVVLRFPPYFVRQSRFGSLGAARSRTRRRCVDGGVQPVVSWLPHGEPGDLRLCCVYAATVL